MNNGVLSDDFLEFDDWQDQDFLESTFSSGNIESELLRKFRSDDYFYRKQAFTDAMLYIQNQQCTENISSLLNAVKFICNDSEPSLRCDLAESLISITNFCVAKELKDEYDCIKSFTLPCVIAFFHDSNKQVRLASHASLMNFISNKLVTKELFYEEIWLALEEIMVAYNPDEIRIECFTLLVQIFQILDFSLEYKLLEFSKDFVSSNDNLRKTCASYLCTIIDKSSNDFVLEWLDIFYKLSEDTSWYVKKFCIECAISFSKRMSHEERWNNITNVYYNFLTDNKKWVTSSAYQNLGAFIATFADSSKSHCELSPNGRIINLLSSCQSSVPSSINNGDLVNTNNLSISAEDSDTSNYNSFQYWKQPLTNNITQPNTVTSVCHSIKNMDLNSLESIIRTEYGNPDLSNYKQDIIPMKLLTSYLNVIHENSDIDLIRSCAYSMPAVMFTLGPSCWPYLRSAYLKLVQSISWKVRVSLASSIQHIFQIFKYDQGAVNDIIWAYREFIKDVDEVKTGLMTNISEFFLSIPIEKYSEIFEDFNDVVHLESTKNWRYRVTCMEQLESVIVDIEIQTYLHIDQFLKIFKKHWLPIIFTSVADEVCAVRISAIEVMLKTMEKLGKWKSSEDIVGKESNIDEIEDIISTIKKKIILFSNSKNWYLRQLFLQSCIKIVKYNILSQEIINESLIPKYLDMCINDPVPNNRMIGGQGLSSLCNQDYLIKMPESDRRKMENVYNFLVIDSDRDVRHSVVKLKDLFESFSIVS